MPKHDGQEPDQLSKTQVKNEMLALQKIGEALVALAPSQLDQIALPDNLLHAIREMHKLKTHESRRRHMQYIGKLMRHVDIEPIQAALKKIQMNREKNTAQFHQIEQWRDRLIAEGDAALQAFIDLYPQADRQKFRQLMRQAKQDRENAKDTGNEKALFRLIRELIQQ